MLAENVRKRQEANALMSQMKFEIEHHLTGSRSAVIAVETKQQVLLSSSEGSQISKTLDYYYNKDDDDDDDCKDDDHDQDNDYSTRLERIHPPCSNFAALQVEDDDAALKGKIQAERILQVCMKPKKIKINKSILYSIKVY